MPCRILYTPEASDDLEEVQRWLTQPGAGPVARRRLVAIRRAINRLRLYPCLYPVGEHPGVREMPCDGGHRALYRVIPDTGRNATAGDVLILRVFGPGQDRAAGQFSGGD